METYERVISAPIFWYNITTLKVSIHMLKKRSFAEPNFRLNVSEI